MEGVTTGIPMNPESLRKEHSALARPRIDCHIDKRSEGLEFGPMGVAGYQRLDKETCERENGSVYLMHCVPAKDSSLPVDWPYPPGLPVSVRQGSQATPGTDSDLDRCACFRVRMEEGKASMRLMCRPQQAGEVAKSLGPGVDC